jgi:hypothetical protein
MTTPTARDIANGIMVSTYGPEWEDAPGLNRIAHVALRDRIASALTAYGDARLEEAAKVAEQRGWHTTAAKIRALASKEPTP